MRIEQSFGEAPNDWDQQLQSLPAVGRYEQSSGWSAIAQRIGHAQPIYLEAKQGKELIACLLCFDRKPWDPVKNTRNNSLIMRLTGRSRGSLDWHWGPTFFTADEEDQRQASKLLAEWIKQYAAQNRLFDISGYLSDQNTPELNALVADVFEQHAFKRKTWATLLIDLSQDEEQLWRNLKSSARKAINKAKRAELVVEEIQTEKAFKQDWLASYIEFERAAGRKVYSEQWFQNFWDLGHPKTQRYFVARLPDTTVLAVLGMTVFNASAREFNSAMSPIAFSSRIPAQDLLHWEMLLAAKASGCQVFNLAGVDPAPESGKASGIRQFKMKWGGQYVEYPRLYKRL